MKDYYKILGVSQNASREEIKEAYRRLSRKFHPDKHNGDRDMERVFAEVNEAYEFLSHNRTNSYQTESQTPPRQSQQNSRKPPRTSTAQPSLSRFFKTTWGRTVSVFTVILIIGALNNLFSQSQPSTTKPSYAPVQNVPDSQPEPTLASQTEKKVDLQRITIEGFYAALTQANGSSAIQYLIPEKRGTGHYTAAGLSSFWSYVDMPLAVTAETPVNLTTWAVSYTYKPTNKDICTDTTTITLEQREGQWLIAKIVPKVGC